jgi:hypothetical protein
MERSMHKATQPFDWHHIVWLAVLVAASVGLSLGFACAVPLAAFAATGALTLKRGAALFLILSIVLANQCVGFAFLHYPAVSSVWGFAFALVGALAIFTAQGAYRSLALAHPIFAYGSAFLVAFVAYEGGLFLITIAVSPGDLATYAAPIVLRVFLINAASFLALMAAARIAAAIGLLGERTGLWMERRPV